jgi:nitrate/nitrite transport system permease protein
LSNVTNATIASSTPLPQAAAAGARRALARLGALLLPLVGVICIIGLWTIVSRFWATDLPSPARTWEVSKPFIVEPFAKRGELDQGILRFTWYSLVLVAKGYALALLIGTPLGFLLGLSTMFRKAFDPIIQILRPVSPLAWLPLGLVLFQNSKPAALFTIAICAMWPTVLNTAMGVRAIPEDYLNVARVLRLSPTKRFFSILVPATLPYVFTGFRLSLGIAWLVIVAVEMLTGAPGVGGFLWQEYNSLIYEHIILCIVTIGLVGFVLDRGMSAIEARLRAA